MASNMAQAYPDDPTPERPRPAVMPAGALSLGRGAWVLPGKLQWSFTTARGPGGQHVNKASTAAILRVPVRDIGGLDEPALARLRANAASALVGDDELLFRSDLYRSQLKNRSACEARLKNLVSHAAVRPKVRKKTKPTWGSVQRRIEGKKQNSERKQRRRNLDD